MTRAPIAHNHLSVIQSESHSQESPIGLLEFSTLLGIAATASSDWPAKLPFGPSDAAAGTETERQIAVIGNRDDVDLPRRIEQSAIYKNIVKRTATGDAPSQLRDALETYLASSGEVWENSWVCFPRERLNEFAGHVFHRDLLADKRLLHGPRRRDAQAFVQEEGGCSYVRIPISYLLKLSLAQAIGRPGVPAMVRDTGERMMTCFVNDNCSPETHSFHPVACSREDSLGKSIAKETALRYLLTQLLANYANGVTLAVLMVFVLLAATGLAPMETGSIVLGVVCLLTPASKWTARLVEKKKYTFSIGGASFAGLVVTPLVLHKIKNSLPCSMRPLRCLARGFFWPAMLRPPV